MASSHCREKDGGGAAVPYPASTSAYGLMYQLNVTPSRGRNCLIRRNPYFTRLFMHMPVHGFRVLSVLQDTGNHLVASTPTPVRVF